MFYTDSALQSKVLLMIKIETRPLRFWFGAFGSARHMQACESHSGLQIRKIPLSETNKH